MVTIRYQVVFWGLFGLLAWIPYRYGSSTLSRQSRVAPRLPLTIPVPRVRPIVHPEREASAVSTTAACLCLRIASASQSRDIWSANRSWGIGPLLLMSTSTVGTRELAWKVSPGSQHLAASETSCRTVEYAGTWRLGCAIART